MSTIFTKIVKGEIPCHKIWEDERFFAFLDNRPSQPGMTLVIPKKEIDSPFDMEDDEYCGLLLAAKNLTEPIRKAVGCVKVGLVIEGLEVPHAHVKLMPLFKPQDLHSPPMDVADEELAKISIKIINEL